jgi:hypothetical protein
LELLSNAYEIKDAKAQTSPAPADTSFFSELSVVVKEAEKYTQGEHDLTFTNKKDGQMAVAKFPIDPLKLGKIADQLADSAPVSVKVTGEHFGDNMTAEWVDASAKKNVIGVDDVKRSSDEEAVVKLTPGTLKGPGTLTLISANHLRASSPVQVK